MCSDCVQRLETACATFISDRFLTLRWTSLIFLHSLSSRGCAGRPRIEIEGILIPLKDETVEQLVKKFFGTFVTDLQLAGALYYLTKNLGM